VELYFFKTDEAAPYIQVEKTAEGSSISEAKKRAEKINYSFDLQGNKLTLDNYLTTDVDSKFRNQKVKVFVYLPEGLIMYTDKSIGRYHMGGYSGMYIPDGDENHFYQLQGEELKCLDCLDEETGESEKSDIELHGRIVIKSDNDSLVVDSNNNNANKDVDINVDRNGVRIKTSTKK